MPPQALPRRCVARHAMLAMPGSIDGHDFTVPLVKLDAITDCASVELSVLVMSTGAGLVFVRAAGI